MKNILLIGSAILATLMAGFALYLQVNSPVQANTLGGGFSLDQAYYLTPGSGVASQAGETMATTSVSFLKTTDTASSTISGFVGRANSIDLYMITTASTSNTTKYQFSLQYSHNNIDWYNEDCSSVDSTILVTHGASGCIHEFTPSSTSRSGKNISLGIPQAKYFKINFGVVGANGSLWAIVVPREENPN